MLHWELSRNRHREYTWQILLSLRNSPLKSFCERKPIPERPLNSLEISQMFIIGKQIILLKNIFNLLKKSYSHDRKAYHINHLRNKG